MLSFYLPQEDFAFAAPRCNRAGYSYGCRPSAGNPVAYKQQRCRSSEPAGSVIIKKCPEAALVTVKLPGATAEDISVVVEGRQLVISGVTVRHLLHPSGLRFAQSVPFHRSFELGNHVNTDGIKARFDSHMLKVWVPYKTKTSSKARRIPVEGPEVTDKAGPSKQPAELKADPTAAPVVEQQQRQTEPVLSAVEAEPSEKDIKGKSPMTAEQLAELEAKQEQDREEEDGSVEDCDLDD